MSVRNIQCGMDSTESVTLTRDLFCDVATTSPFIIMQGPDAILDCNGHKIFGSNVERRFGSPTHGSGISITGDGQGVVLYIYFISPFTYL